MKKVRIYPPCPECMDPELKSGGQWIQKATASIKRRGTEGKCTGSNYGGPGCPPGSKAYNLAKTFRKMARERKKEFGGEADQNIGINEYGQSMLDNFKRAIAGQAVQSISENALLGAMQNPPGMFPYGGDNASGYGYNPEQFDIAPYIQQKIDLENAFNTSMWNLGTSIPGAFKAGLKAKTEFDKTSPYYQEYKRMYREQEKQAKRDARNPLLQYIPMQQFGGPAFLPEFQQAGQVPVSVTPQTSTSYRVQAHKPVYPSMTVGEAIWPSFNEDVSWISNFWNGTPNNQPPTAYDIELDKKIKQKIADRKSKAGIKPITGSSQSSKSTTMSTEEEAKKRMKKYQDIQTRFYNKMSGIQETQYPTKGTTKGTGTGTKGSGITDADVYGTGETTTGTDAASQVQAYNTGNYNTDYASTEETGNAGTQGQGYGYGYNPYYNPFVVYPQMGMFGNRTGRMPIAFNAADSGLTGVDYRWNPFAKKDAAGNRHGQVKRLEFTHYVPLDYQRPAPAPAPTPKQTPITKNTPDWMTDNQIVLPVNPTQQKWTYGNTEPAYAYNGADDQTFQMAQYYYGGNLPFYQLAGEFPGAVGDFMNSVNQFGVIDPMLQEDTLPINPFTGKTAYNKPGAPTVTDRNNTNLFPTKEDEEERIAREEREKREGVAKTFVQKARPFMGNLVGPALAAATSIGKQMTTPAYNLENLTAAEKVFARRRIADMGEIPFNFAGNYMDLAAYTPVQNKGYTAKKGGSIRKFQQGGTYDLTDAEIQELLDSGAEIEFLD